MEGRARRAMEERTQRAEEARVRTEAKMAEEAVQEAAALKKQEAQA